MGTKTVSFEFHLTLVPVASLLIWLVGPVFLIAQIVLATMKLLRLGPLSLSARCELGKLGIALRDDLD